MSQQPKQIRQALVDSHVNECWDSNPEGRQVGSRNHVLARKDRSGMRQNIHTVLLLALQYQPFNARMAELVDALVLGTSTARCGSSSLSTGTKFKDTYSKHKLHFFHKKTSKKCILHNLSIGSAFNTPPCIELSKAGAFSPIL